MIFNSRIINKSFLYLLCLIISLEFFSLFYVSYKDIVNAAIILLSFFLMIFLILYNNPVIKSYHYYFFFYFIFSLTVSVFIHLYQLGTLFWLAIFLKIFIFCLMIFFFYYCVALKTINNLINVLFLFFVISIILGFVVSNYNFLNDRLRFNGSAVTGSFISMLSGLFLCHFVGGLADFRFLKFSKGLLVCLMLVTLLYFIGSRQPFVGFFISLILALLSLRRSSFIFFSSCVFFIFLYNFDYIINFLNDFESFFLLESINDNSLLYRFKYIAFSFDYMNSFSLIVFGMGLNSFPLLFPAGDAGSLHATHNLLLFFFVNFGLLGITFFLCAYIYFLYTADFRNKLLLYYLIFGCSLNNPEYFLSVLFLLVLVFF